MQIRKHAIWNNVQTVKIVLTFQHQAFEGFVSQQLKSLSNNININIQAVFKSQSIQGIFQPKEKSMHDVLS